MRTAPFLPVSLQGRRGQVSGLLPPPPGPLPAPSQLAEGHRGAGGRRPGNPGNWHGGRGRAEALWDCAFATGVAEANRRMHARAHTHAAGRPDVPPPHPRLFRGSSDRLLGNVCLTAEAVTEPEARPAPSGAAAAASEPVPEGPALALTGRRYGKARGFTCLQDGAPGPGAARLSAWPFSTGDVALGGHSGRDGASVRKREGCSPAAPSLPDPRASPRPRSPGHPSSARRGGGTRGPCPVPSPEGRAPTSTVGWP